MKTKNKKFVRTLIWLLIFIFPWILSSYGLHFYPWTRGTPLWGEAFLSFDYAQWLKTYSQAWGYESFFGVNHLNFPETIGQYQIFSTFSVPTIRLWLEIMTILSKIFGKYFFWFYINLGLVLPFWSMFYLAWHWSKKNLWLSVLASFLFATSPIVLERTLAGVTTYCIAMSMLPILIVLAGKFRLKKTWYNLIIAASLFLIGGVVAVLAPHFMIIFGIWWFFDFLFPKFTDGVFGQNLRANKIISFFIILAGAGLLTINAWLPPLYFELPSRTISQSYFVFRQLAQSLKTITYLNTLTFSAGGMENGLDIFKSYPFVIWVRLFFAFISVLAVVLLRKKRIYLMFGFFILGIILSAGITPPFGSIFVWLYKNFPGFSSFRDPTKFLILPVLASLILLIEIVKPLDLLSAKKIIPVKIGISALILAVAILSVPYFYSGYFQKLIIPKKIDQNFSSTSKWISQNMPKNSRVLIWPEPHGVNQELEINSLAPSIQKSYFLGLKKFDVSFINPSGICDYPSCEYSRAAIKFAESGNWQILYEFFNLNYLIFDSSWGQKLANAQNLKKVFSNQRFSIYQISSSSKGLFIEKNPTLLSTLDAIYRSYQYNLFSITLDEETLTNKNLPNWPVFFYNQDPLGALMETIPKKYHLSFEKLTRHNVFPNWQILAAGDGELIKQGVVGASSNAITTTEKASLSIPVEIKEKSQVYIKALVGQDFGNALAFFFNNQKIGEIEFSGFSWSGYRWFFINNLPSEKGNLEIRSLRQEKTIIDQIIILPESQQKIAENEFSNFVKSRSVNYYFSPNFLESSSIFYRKFGAGQLFALSKNKNLRMGQNNLTAKEFFELDREKSSKAEILVNIDLPEKPDSFNFLASTVYASDKYPVKIDFKNFAGQWQNIATIVEDNPTRVFEFKTKEKIDKLKLKITLETKEQKGSAQINFISFWANLDPASTLAKIPDNWQKLSESEIDQKLGSEKKYLSSVQNRVFDQSELLIRLDSYDPNWRLGKITPIKVLGYAQGYVVPKQSVVGDFVYLPEKIYHRTFILSNILWLITLAVLILSALCYISSSLISSKLDSRWSLPHT